MTDLPSADDSPSDAADAEVRADGGTPSDDTRTDGDPSDRGDADAEFEERLDHARGLLTDDATACYVGVVRDGREVDSTFAQRANDAQQEGMQALSLLASHLRLVADEAGVEYETVADDAATLARRLDESR